jgi:hypothetical protein
VIKTITAKAVHYSRKLTIFYKTKNAQKWGYRVLLIVSVILLFGTTLYGAVESGKYFSISSDAIVDPYLFANGLHRHTIVLPDQHTNILKLPLFYLEGNIPYHYLTLVTISSLLVVVSVVAWAYLLIYIFGKRYTILILALLSALMFSSALLNINLGETTVRNIEFPISLWFIIIINRVLMGLKRDRKANIFFGLGCILYCLVVAGDNYFEYAISLPILLVLIWYWVQSRTFSIQMFKASSLVVVTSLIAVLIKLLLIKTGIIVTFKSAIPPLVTYNNLWPSITTAVNQFLGLQGASIFDTSATIHTFAIFVNFALIIVGIVGFILILRHANTHYRDHRRLTENNSFLFTTGAVSFFTVFWVYVLSGEVVQTLSNGQVVSLGQIRYIAFLPFLLLISVIWVIRNYYSNHRLLMALVIAVSFMEVATTYSTQKAFYADTIMATTPTKATLSTIVVDLHKDKVSEVVTGYWYGATVRFLSHDTIDFAPIDSCNIPFNFNVREDWYQPRNGEKTALIVDRSGPDASYWAGCSSQTLTALYGMPVKQQEVSDPTTQENLSIWVYNYDVRSRLQPYPVEPGQ